MRFVKLISKQFVMSIMHQLAKAKAKHHAESNKQLVNMNEGSAKDEDIKQEPDEHSCNSKLVFPKALTLCRNFQLFRF